MSSFRFRKGGAHPDAIRRSSGASLFFNKVGFAIERDLAAAKLVRDFF
jgi:hypothetical protein